jgi:hypothetical protein
MAATDPYALTIRQAAHDAVRALLTSAPDSPEGSATLREVTAWLAHEHGQAAVPDLTEELAVDLAEALDAMPRSSSATRWRSPTAGSTIRPRRTCPVTPQTRDGPTSVGDAMTTGRDRGPSRHVAHRLGPAPHGAPRPNHAESATTHANTRIRTGKIHKALTQDHSTTATKIEAKSTRSAPTWADGRS